MNPSFVGGNKEIGLLGQKRKIPLEFENGAIYIEIPNSVKDYFKNSPAVVFFLN